MDSRKEALLSQIIKEHIKSANPVGSKLLESKCRLGVSSATIRNEMAELEKDGYITHPHTSAGRLPTEKGYRYFLDHLIKFSELGKKEQESLQAYLNGLKGRELDSMIKQAAKYIAEVSKNTVVVGFSDRDVYYTGIANLFSQPEFNRPDCVYDLSLLVDHSDKVMSEIFESIQVIEVRIGTRNPFGNQCSVVLAPWRIKSQKGILGILGPMRMDYERNLGLVKFFSQNI